MLRAILELNTAAAALLRAAGAIGAAFGEPAVSKPSWRRSEPERTAVRRAEAAEQFERRPPPPARKPMVYGRRLWPVQECACDHCLSDEHTGRGGPMNPPGGADRK